MPIEPISAEMERWLPLARAVTELPTTFPVPLHAIFGESVDVARFHAKYWATRLEGTTVVRRGLDSAAGPNAGKPLLHADTGEEILSLVRASQDAHARYLLAIELSPRSPADRGRVVLREIRGALEYLLDDDVEEQNDARLARLVATHAQDPNTINALALALENFATLADLHRQALDGLGGFPVDLIDEATTLARELRERSPSPSPMSAEMRDAIELRNRLIALLLDRVNVVRSAARFVFRDDPIIAREATSAYTRRRRAAARRASATAEADEIEADEREAAPVGE